jgi:hypothetical protein
MGRVRWACGEWNAGTDEHAALLIGCRRVIAQRSLVKWVLDKKVALNIVIDLALQSALLLVHRCRIVVHDNKHIAWAGISRRACLTCGLCGANQFALAALGYSVHIEGNRHYILL